MNAKKVFNLEETKGFGVRVPFAEPQWYSDSFASPYYTESHKQFRAKLRAFVDTELIPYVHEWDEAGTYPHELHAKAYAAGVYGAVWPKEYGGTPPDNFDYFHDLIFIDELSRCAAGGVLWAVFFSFGIALPPILNTGSQYLKDKVARDVITGKKIMSLAVTEPYAGSDVASLRTTAVKSACGKYYIVSGEKKFITSGVKADYFTCAARTGGPGIGGISLFLLEKGMEGLSVRRQKTQGWWISNTAYVVMDKIKVPVENLIGKENQGFKAIMHNFNHERFVLAAMCNRYSRVCLEESIKYARLRNTFGKRLIDHQVIRHKMAEMARGIEVCHSYLEVLAYQMNAGKLNDIGGAIALCKVHSSKTMEFCAREASQIMGGNSYLRGGIGEKVERLYREVRVNAIGGGSEEVMLNLVGNQAKL
jgi:alkylation response protein AidB-like acyl-CoA dehydrogenase